MDDGTLQKQLAAANEQVAKPDEQIGNLKTAAETTKNLLTKALTEEENNVKDVKDVTEEKKELEQHFDTCQERQRRQRRRMKRRRPNGRRQRKT